VGCAGFGRGRWKMEEIKELLSERNRVINYDIIKKIFCKGKL
jgi:hypothetical protein